MSEWKCTARGCPMYLNGFDAGEAFGHMIGVQEGYACGLKETNRAQFEEGYRAAEEDMARLQRHGVAVAQWAASNPIFEELCHRRGDVVRAAQARADRERIDADGSPWRRVLGGAA